MPQTRTRLARADRRRQLLDIAWRLIRREGADALTLGRLAEQAGVTKPVVYDHFGTRNGLLLALYQEYDARQTSAMDAALEAAQPTLAAVSRVIASNYVSCVLSQGSEIPGVSAALAGSPELEKVKRDCELAWIDRCATALGAFSEPRLQERAGLWAILGAAESLSRASVAGDLSEAKATDELTRLIVGIAERS